MKALIKILCLSVLWVSCAGNTEKKAQKAYKKEQACVNNSKLFSGPGHILQLQCGSLADGS